MFHHQVGHVSGVHTFKAVEAGTVREQTNQTKQNMDRHMALTFVETASVTAPGLGVYLLTCEQW